MKDLFFAADLLTVFRHDTYYGDYKNISVALRKVGLAAVKRTDSIEQMVHALVVHIMDQHGESEPFLAGTFICPEAVVQLLKEYGLPAPAALQPASTEKNNSKESVDQAQFEQYFDIGRLIFRTFLETRQNLGINATGRYVLEHLTVFDTDKIVTAVNEDSVTWLTDESKEKLTSVETIAKFVLNFNRELETLL